MEINAAENVTATTQPVQKPAAEQTTAVRDEAEPRKETQAEEVRVTLSEESVRLSQENEEAAPPPAAEPEPTPEPEQPQTDAEARQPIDILA